MRLYIGNKGITAYPYDGCKPFEAKELGIYNPNGTDKPPMTLYRDSLRKTTRKELLTLRTYIVNRDGSVLGPFGG